jgi:chromosome segregation ATPase
MVARVIEQSDISKVCDDMVSRGEAPATTAVLKILGKGSPNTIQKYIKVWREENEASGTEIAVIDVELPESFKSSLESFGRQLYNAAESEMQTTITRIQAEKEDAISKIETEMQDINDASELLANDKAELEDQLEVSKKQNQSLGNTIHELEKDLVKQKATSETQIAEALAMNINLSEKVKTKETEIKTITMSSNNKIKDLELSNSKNEAETDRLKGLLSDSNKTISEALSKQIESDKSLSDNKDELSEVQTELKIALATAQEKEKSFNVQVSGLQEQINILKMAMEKIEVKAPVARKKVVRKKAEPK